MTEPELIDRLREAIVLDGPDAWRTNGYLQDAQAAGLSITDALKRAGEISQEVSNNSLLYQNIQARIVRLGQPARAAYIEQDINQIINAARSLHLSPDFVRNRWIPILLARQAPPTVAATPAPPPVVTEPPKPEAPVESAEPADAYEELIEDEPEPPTAHRSSATNVPPAPVVPPPPVYMPPAPPREATLPPPPAPVVRTFTATPARVRKGQAVTLDWDVENLLAVTIDDLGEGLSPKNRGWVKPSKTTDYTLFDANNNPLSTVRVEVIPRDRSGVYGVLFALALLALIYWFIRRNSTTTSRSEGPARDEQAYNPPPSETSGLNREETPAPVREPEPLPESEATDTRPNEPAATITQPDPADERATSTPDPALADEPVAQQPATPADARQGKYEEAFGDKPYDKVEMGTDERGWRRARSRGRWGYIDQNDNWVIQPEYEAVTPFRGNTATAFLNGRLITINREGEQVR